MPQVGLAAPWGDTERGDERAARADSREAHADRPRQSSDGHRYAGPRPVAAASHSPHAPAVSHVSRRTDRAVAGPADFDFAAARAASAARRRSGPARPAAHFAEPAIEADAAPAAPRTRRRADWAEPAEPRPAEPRRRSRRLEAVAETREARPEPVLEAPPRLSADGRRIVTITGRGSERYAPVVQRRRSSQRPYEREGFRPDRAAMWAVLLGVLMILAAATSSHAAVLAHHAAAHTLAALGAR